VNSERETRAVGASVQFHHSTRICNRIICFPPGYADRYASTNHTNLAKR